METRKNETQRVVLFNVEISKKKLQLLTIIFAVAAVAGVILFFTKHF